MIGNYLTSIFFMLLVLLILFIRVFYVIKEKKSRRRCLILFAATFAYVIISGLYIIGDLNEDFNVNVFRVIVFIFYIIYTLLPFAWHIFVRNFVGKTFDKFILKIEIIPIIILMGLVLLTPFTDLVWYIDGDKVYQRGPLFRFYIIFNYFYYVETLIDLVIIKIKNKQNEEPYRIQSILISLVPLAGAVINNFVFPMYTGYTFQPFCSVIVAMLAFFFMGGTEAEQILENNQKAIEVALTQAQEATKTAIEASNVKSKFLSNMSHDIRTPMNAIINLTKLAEKEEDINVIKEYLHKMEISGEFLLGLINDILDMSRIENGEIKLHKENLTRSEFVNTVDTVIKPLMEAKKINFHSELRPGEYTISVDKLRFNQIFFNLLSNAAKFTPAGGDVWFEVDNLEVENNKLKIKFVVRDNGIGMSEEFLTHLFEPFARERNEYTNKVNGTGLGLPIVKSLVEAMDGEISVKSKLGEGSEFDVIFYVDIVSKDEITQTENKFNDYEKLKGLHILLVEDNEINTYVQKILLEQVGCIVTAVDNGKKAVDAFNESKLFTYNAILMDVRMPVMDGIEATKEIRALNRPDAGSVQIIAMTADAFDDERKRTIESGMNYHLSKPIDAEKLYKALSECIHW